MKELKIQPPSQNSKNNKTVEIQVRFFCEKCNGTGYLSDEGSFYHKICGNCIHGYIYTWIPYKP